MEVINGEFYMVGCEDDDPFCIHTADELEKLIKKIGFLPLFSNEIPGFSVEEHTAVSSWWSGNPETDPWIWRQILSGKKDIAYGKFFDKKAGYVSKKWFSVFANYRRNGYDFEALVGDELASYRAQKIMNALELNDELCGEELLSFELKEKAGFGKGGEKNFEGILTELQMQTFLLMSDFRQKVNKKGQPYGWHIGALETPETKWGYDLIAEGYKESPEESWEKIVKQIRKFYPDAEEEQLHKVMGIRRPGASKTTKVKKKGKPYPGNLIAALGIPKNYWRGENRELNTDQLEGLAYALDLLTEAMQMVIRAKYEDYMTYQEIADLYHLTKERIESIHAKAIRLLKRERRLPFIVYGYSGWQLKQQEDKDAHRAALKQKADAICKKAGIKDADAIPVSDLEVSVRTKNALERYGISTLLELLMNVVEMSLTKRNIRNLGTGSISELKKALEVYGIQLTEKGGLIE